MTMSLAAFFTWCEHTAVGTAVRESIWLFPIIEVVHLVGLAVLGGAVLLVDLRLIGIGLHGVPVATLARSARPWLLGSLALTVVSGVLLFLSEALKCYGNPAFRTTAEVRGYLSPMENDQLVLAGRAKVGALFGPDIDEIPPDRLFFAGEACSTHDFSTAHGAYLTGIAAAERAIAAHRR